MAKVPIKPIVKVAKAAAPKVKKFLKNNPDKVIAAAGGIAGGFGKIVKGGVEFINTRGDRKKAKGKVPYRKIKFLQYQNEILPNIDSFSNIKLNSYKHEVENFIKQIRQEEKNQLIANKPLNSKRIKSWEEIFVQIEDKIKTKNYEEFLKAYNSPSYTSDYLDEKVINFLRNIEDKDELYKFIHQYTDRDLKDIKKDFF